MTGVPTGLDKNGDHIDALATLGFGFIEIGTVTPRQQPGNPLPRMFRLPQARAIINRPSCILYDEPTSGLDPVVSDSINRLIRRLQERYRVTSVVVTHDMKSAFHVGDHIAYLHEGRIYFYGSPAEIQASTDPLIQDFLVGRASVAD